MESIVACMGWSLTTVTVHLSGRFSHNEGSKAAKMEELEFNSIV